MRRWCATPLQWDREVPGIYVTLNPINTALLARSRNRAIPFCDTTTADGDVTARRWLPIDCDPVRPAGIPSTDGEHDAALARARAIREALAARGWPDPILADSGNGAHLLYRVDLPADDGGLLARCLEALAFGWDDGAVTIDRSVHNPARIWKVYGTVARKGDGTPDRPQRLAHSLMCRMRRCRCRAPCWRRSPPKCRRPRPGRVGAAWGIRAVGLDRDAWA